MHISDTATLEFVARDVRAAPRPERSTLRTDLATLLPMTAVCTLLGLLTAVATIMSGADLSLLMPN